MGAVSGSERIVAVDVAVGSELLGEFLLLFLESGFRSLELFIGLTVFLFQLGLLFFVVAGVLEHEDFARLEGLDLVVGGGAVRSESNGLAEKLGEVVGDDLEGGVRGDALFIGASHVAHENEAAALFENVFDGGESALDAGVVLDDSVFDRHIEVDAHDNAFAFEIDVTQSFLVHDQNSLEKSLKIKKGGRSRVARPFKMLLSVKQ